MRTRAGYSAVARICVGFIGFRYGCNDRRDPDGRRVLIIAIALIAVPLTAMSIIIASATMIIWIADVFPGFVTMVAIAATIVPRTPRTSTWLQGTKAGPRSCGGLDKRLCLFYALCFV